MLHFRLLLVFILLAPGVKSQFLIRGQIFDLATREPLAFVNIISSDGKCGTSTDIEGKYTLKCDTKPEVLKLSYIGYYSREYLVDPNVGYHLIYMEKGSTELESVDILPGINPADTIMEKVISNRKKNDPERAVDFSYRSYSKFIVTLALDSTLVLHPEKMEKLDTNQKEMIDFFENQHLFLTESVTERIYVRPASDKETVVAARVSGFQNPVFNLLATELQSFTFYREVISLAGTPYEGPVSPGSTKRYFFQIEDTLFGSKDTLWTISFRPKKGKAFKGMKGQMVISSNGYAIVKVIAEPYGLKKDELKIKIQQQYEWVEQKQWFPVQLNTTMYFPNIQMENMELVGFSNAYLKDIRLGKPDEKIRKPAYIALETDPDAGKKADPFWEQHRRDSLSQKERNTYRVIDSLGKAQKLERRVNALLYLSEGQIPVKFVSLDLGRFISFNDYEGFRAGMGLSTNDRLSKYFSVGGYFAYGFKDKSWKKGVKLSFLVPGRDIHLDGYWQDDLEETGGIEFFERKSLTLSQDLSELFRDRFDRAEKYGVRLGLRINKHIKVFPFGEIQSRSSFPGYEQELVQENLVVVQRENYQLFHSGAALRVQWGERFVKSGNRIISEGSLWPVIWIKWTHGMDNLLGGEIAYNKFDLRIEKRHRVRRAGHITYRIGFGKVQGEHVPLGLFYNPRGTWRPMRDLNVVSGFGFETMRTNEFLADEFASLHFKWEMGSLFFKGKFRPQFALVSNHLNGTLSPENAGQITTTKAAEGLFSESGILINSLIKSGISGIGVGGFYRYGQHQLPDVKDNFAVKISFSFSL